MSLPDFGTGGEERGPFHRSDCRYLPVILMGAPMKSATLLARAALDSGRASAEPETVTIGAPRLGGDGLRVSAVTRATPCPT